MDGVDQSFADRLPPLPAARARTDGVTKRARDHRVHRFALPTLPKQAIQAGVSDAISPRAAFGVHQMTAPPNGWNESIRSHGVTITARIG